MSSDAELLGRAQALVAKYAPVDVELIGRTGIEELGAAHVVLVDCRTAAERAVSVIPHAISRDEFERTRGAEAALAAKQTVVPYCTVGMRSGSYARQLISEYADRGLAVKNGEGVLLWSIEGGKLEGPDGAETLRLHTFGPEFRVVRLEIEAVQFAGRGAGGLIEIAREGIARLFGGR
ncbi:hypothetical protein T492DRAFT_940479 [Pavlovales sp. CCMP2436]|nr:hypothetical protein T492DRAFT_940479 [Pavlovales sp. CCMP2436]|mmetsp:Transcript_34567/g.86225  ORF Transcript_34567/g.86225 Transcript_34567/m.86225 type:complete len:178 (-) Transcript_34567:63-596(-)